MFRQWSAGENNSERKSGKKRGETGEPSFFPALSLAIIFARAPLSERLEQATLSRASSSLTGRCTIQNDANEELLFTVDHVLALTPDNKVKADVQEPMRIVACSVPGDPSMSPTRLLLKSLSEVIDSDRNVFFERGYSRRFLAAPDGFNLSVHNTLCHPNHITSLHYQHNVEANYFIKGQGEYVLQNGEGKHEFDSEKHSGTLILLDREAHVVKIGATDSIVICVFFPPLKGTERLKFNQEFGSSY